MTTTHAGEHPPTVAESLAECRRLTDELHDLIADFMDERGFADPVTGERRPLVKASLIFPGHVVRRPAADRWRRVAARIVHPDGTVTFTFDDGGRGDRVSRLARYEQGLDDDLDRQQALRLDVATLPDPFDHVPVVADEVAYRCEMGGCDQPLSAPGICSGCRFDAEIGGAL